MNNGLDCFFYSILGTYSTSDGLGHVMTQLRLRTLKLRMTLCTFPPTSKHDCTRLLDATRSLDHL